MIVSGFWDNLFLEILIVFEILIVVIINVLGGENVLLYSIEIININVIDRVESCLLSCSLFVFYFFNLFFK